MEHKRVSSGVPRAKELAPLLQLKPLEPNATKRRLEKALTGADLRAIARRRTPKAPFDYADKAADAEASLARARQTFLDIEFQPAIWGDVSKISSSTDALGKPSTFLFGIALTGIYPDNAYRGSQCHSSRRRQLGRSVKRCGQRSSMVCERPIGQTILCFLIETTDHSSDIASPWILTQHGLA